MTRTAAKSIALKSLQRCSWAGDDPLYIHYHDSEWGVPKADDNELFEKLVLEGFQSGLSWITILRKRENFRKAFDQFDPEKIAGYGKKDFDRLMNDTGIVRNRLKVQATIDNAKAYLALAEKQSLGSFLWGFMEDGPIVNSRASMKDVPGQTELSQRMSKALKKQGFRFVGPTTLYAFMQSTGMVNDHMTNCPRHAPCTQLQKRFKPPRI